MANTTPFKTYRGRLVRDADMVNHEMAPAYAFSPEHHLAQIAVTGCGNGAFYASAESQQEAAKGR